MENLTLLFCSGLMITGSPFSLCSYHGSAPQLSVSPVIVPPATVVTNADHPNSRGGNFRPNIPPSMTNGSTYTPHRLNGYSNGVPQVRSNLAGGGGLASTYHIVESEDVKLAKPVYQDGRSNAPPLETKGKYSCPRCERKFESNRIWTDHKIRCMV